MSKLSLKIAEFKQRDPFAIKINKHYFWVNSKKFKFKGNSSCLELLESIPQTYQNLNQFFEKLRFELKRQAKITLRNHQRFEREDFKANQEAYLAKFQSLESFYLRIKSHCFQVNPARFNFDSNSSCLTLIPRYKEKEINPPKINRFFYGELARQANSLIKEKHAQDKKNYELRCWQEWLSLTGHQDGELAIAALNHSINIKIM